MTTLVTGAAGFVGSEAVDQLLRRGDRVRALVRHEDQAVALRSRGVETFVGDVRDAGVVERAVQGVDVVQHCAAAVGPNYSHRDVHEINLGGVRNALEGLRKNGRGRLVLVSSINVLGCRDLNDVNEDEPCRRIGESHADSKIDAEALARDFREQHGVEVVVVRPGLIYGPGEKNIPRILDAISRGKFKFLGSRDNIVPMLHVSDVVQGMLRAAETPAAAGRTYFLTDGARTTIGELVDYLAELSNLPKPEKVMPLALPKAVCSAFELLHTLHLTNKPGPISRTALRFIGTSRLVDISRAKQELGYAPQVAFRDGIAATVRSLAEAERAA